MLFYDTFNILNLLITDDVYNFNIWSDIYHPFQPLEENSGDAPERFL